MGLMKLNGDGLWYTHYTPFSDTSIYHIKLG